MVKARKQQMPMCTYAAGCTRPGCIYRHPPKGTTPKSEAVCMPHLAGFCEFGARCRNVHPPDEEADALRRKYSRTECEWGVECRNRFCLYNHRGLDDDFLVDSLVRTQLSDAQPATGRMPALPGGVWQDNLQYPEELAWPDEAAAHDGAASSQGAAASGAELFAEGEALACGAQCAGCGAIGEGRVDMSDGCFYCSLCWEAFEPDEIRVCCIVG